MMSFAYILFNQLFVVIFQLSRCGKFGVLTIESQTSDEVWFDRDPFWLKQVIKSVEL